MTRKNKRRIQRAYNKARPGLIIAWGLLTLGGAILGVLALLYGWSELARMAYDQAGPLPPGQDLWHGDMGG